MKKIFLLLISAITMGTSIYAWERVPLTVSFDDNMPIGNGNPRTPMQPPVVYIEDYTLIFTINHPDFTLTINDEDGYVVYTTTVFSAKTEVILPSTLSGDYEIQLAMSNWLFTGWINL